LAGHDVIHKAGYPAAVRSTYVEVTQPTVSLWIVRLNLAEKWVSIKKSWAHKVNV
jgi:hypothetical protein